LEFPYGLVTVGAILPQRLPDHTLQPHRYVRIDPPGQLGLLVQDGVDQQWAVGFRKRTFAGGKFAEQNARRPDISTAVGRLAS